MKKVSILLLASALALTNADLQEGVHRGQEGAYYATHKLEERLHEGGHTLQEGVQRSGNRLDETFEKGQHRAEELIDRASLGLESARDYLHHKIGDTNILSRGADSIKHTYDAAGNLIKEGLHKAEEGLHFGGHRTQETLTESRNTLDEKVESGKHRGEELGYRTGHKIEEAADKAREAVGDAIDSINAGLHLGHRHGGVLGRARDAVEGVSEGIHGAAHSVKEGIYDTADSIREHIPGLHKPTMGDKISGAYEDLKDHLPGHKETFGERIHGAYENLRDRMPGSHHETLGDKFQDAIDRAREYIPEAHKPTLGERIHSAYENLKEHLPGHHHEEDPTLKERIKGELTQRAEQAVKAATGYKAIETAAKHSEEIKEKAGKLYDRVFHHEEPEPEREPTFTEKISNTFSKLINTITGKTEPEEPVRDPTLRERVSDSIHHAQESISSKFHREGEQVEEPPRDPSLRERLSDSYHHAQESISSKFHREGRQDEQVEQVEEPSRDPTLKERATDALHHVSDKFHRNTDGEQMPTNTEPLPETPETTESTGLGGKIKEGLHKIGDSIKSVIGLGGHEAENIAEQVRDIGDKISEGAHYVGDKISEGYDSAKGRIPHRHNDANDIDGTTRNEGMVQNDSLKSDDDL